MSRRRQGRAVEVLLVEDNPADVRLTREALAEGKVVVKLPRTGEIVMRREM
jgi:CheY-like chemotaxis protein